MRSTLPPRTDPWSAATADRAPTRHHSVWTARRKVAALAPLVGAVGVVGRMGTEGGLTAATLVAVSVVTAGVFLATVWPPRRRSTMTIGLLALTLAASSAGALIVTPRATVVALWCTALAAVALADPWRLRFGATPPAMGTALVPLIAAQVSWFRSSSPALIVAVFLVALSLVAFGVLHPERSDRANVRFRRAVVSAATAAGNVVLFAMVAVLLYAPGTLGRMLDVHRRRRRTSYWSDRSPSTEELVRDAARPFTTTEPGTRRRRQLGGAMILVIVITAVVWQNDRSVDHEAPDVFDRAAEVRLSELAAFSDAEFADELKAEQDVLSNEFLLPAAVGGYDVADFTGRFTNVEDGARHTLATSCAQCPPATVWMIGGSAAFGLGQRDEHTIASGLVRLGDERDRRLDVFNLGVPGWTLHQESQKVLDRIGSAEPSPDLVIFYNGFNDVLGTVIGSTVNGVDPDAPALLDIEDIRQFTDAGLDPRDVASGEQIAALAAEKYLREARHVSDLLAAEGVDALFVFQPDALASQSQYTEVEWIFDFGDDLRDYLDSALQGTAENVGPDVVNLRHLLDDQPPSFADLVHTNEGAARLVAQALYPHVDDRLQRRGADHG